MRKALAAVCLLIAAPLHADDTALAKETFEKFTGYQKTSDPRLLDLLTPDCSGTLVESDETFDISTQLSKEQFRKGLQSAIDKKSTPPGTYEETTYTESPGGFWAKGIHHIVRPEGDFKGPFSVAFKKAADGTVQIRSMRIAVPLQFTAIKSHGQFELSMPGEWETTEVPKQETPDGGPVIYPGTATSPTGNVLSYLAFEFPGRKTADQKLENFPGPVCEPIIAKMEKAGAKELGRTFNDLEDGDNERAYYAIRVQAPTGDAIQFSGIVVRTAKRVYVIQEMGSRVLSRETWQKIAKSFKEL